MATLRYSSVYNVYNSWYHHHCCNFSVRLIRHCAIQWTYITGENTSVLWEFQELWKHVNKLLNQDHMMNIFAVKQSSVSWAFTDMCTWNSLEEFLQFWSITEIFNNRIISVKLRLSAVAIGRSYWQGKNKSVIWNHVTANFIQIPQNIIQSRFLKLHLS